MTAEKDLYTIYLRWVICDPKERYPETLDKFLEEYQLTRNDLDEYEARPTYYSDVEREIRNWGISKLPEVMRKACKDATSDKANSGSIRAFKELLEESKSKVNNINFFSINPSDEQYKKILGRESKRINDNSHIIDITPLP